MRELTNREVSLASGGMNGGPPGGFYLGNPIGPVTRGQYGGLNGRFVMESQPSSLHNMMALVGALTGNTGQQRGGGGSPQGTIIFASFTEVNRRR